MFGDGRLVGTIGRQFDSCFEPLLVQRPRPGLRDRMPSARQLAEHVEQRQSSLPHPQAEDFSRKNITEAIDDDARQAIGFGVHETIRIGDVVELQQIATERYGRGQTVSPPRCIGNDFAATQQSDCHLRAWIEQSIPERLTFTRDDAHEIAMRGSLIPRTESLAEQVRMPRRRSHLDRGKFAFRRVRENDSRAALEREENARSSRRRTLRGSRCERVCVRRGENDRGGA